MSISKLIKDVLKHKHVFDTHSIAQEFCYIYKKPEIKSMMQHHYEFKYHNYKKTIIGRNDNLEISIIEWKPNSYASLHTHDYDTLICVLDGMLKETIVKDSFKKDHILTNGNTSFLTPEYSHCIDNVYFDSSFSLNISGIDHIF